MPLEVSSTSLHHLGHATTNAHTAVQVATSIQPSIQFLTVAFVLAVICMFTIALYAHAKIEIRMGALNMTTYRPRRRKPRR